MIKAIFVKEFTQYRRDRRVVGLAVLLFALIAFSLLTARATQASQRRQANRAQQEDRAVFQEQGEKTPHAAAHFGRLAYKKLPPLALFDPGAAPYLGQVIWLEAHTRNPAMFRPAEDSADLRRLADLSVAGILALLIPLIAFLLGYGSFAAERERGTLRLAISTGAGLKRLFIGKIIAIATLLGAITTAALVVPAFMACLAPGDVAVGDIALRAVGLLLGFLAYGLSCSAFAIFVSARAPSATAALLVLLSLWSISVIILPKVAASLAGHIHPTPDATTFWRETADTIQKQRPDRQSTAFRALEKQVISAALGREVGTEEIASLALNRPGMMFEIGERIGAKAYGQAYDALFETYANQKRVRRWFSPISPTIVLQHLSQTLAGTDISSHRHFSEQAEAQRLEIVRKMNEEMMLQGAGQSFYYRANADFWASIPDFSYAQPTGKTAIHIAFWDFFLLLTWSTVMVLLAYHSCCRQQMI